jgi:uroporphyrinogen-III decarboxylase
MLWSREAYLDLMTFGPVERPMFSELFGPLIGLPEEWLSQGASPAELDMTAFDWDYVPYVAVGHCGPHKEPSVLISDTPEERVERDFLGRTMKLVKKTATIALPMDFPVKTMDDWRALKPRFVFDESRVNWAQVARAKAWQAQGHVLVVGIPGAFDMPRELMGEEIACMAYYDQPELMHDMLATFADTSARVLERLAERHATIDQLSVHEDFAGRSGPLVGPGQIDEHFRRYYRRCWDVARSAGARVFMLDSDGNLNSVIPALLDCGLTAIHPMEPAAGMDIVQLRAAYGTRLAFSGGIDKHVLRRSKADIRKELEYKLQKPMWTGAVLGLDHRIPNGTPLENYRYYVKTGREILGLPPLNETRRGWGRMAF